MRVIYKYSLAVTDVQRIAMPRGAQLLTVQMQGSLAQLWALVDPSEPQRKRLIVIIGTGNPIESNPGRYIATFRSPPFVWHVFDATEAA